MEEEKELYDTQEVDLETEKGKTHGDATYNADSITVLDGLEAVRIRPGMYIGTTSVEGLHHLVWEICDNAIDEALAGFATRITITLNNDGSVTIKDNGRGIPTDIVDKSGVSGVETAYTTLHAGGKFGDGNGYKVAGGLHGVGASVVNALSEYVEVVVERDGNKHYVRFENGGHTVAPLHIVGTSTNRGTTVTFKPDKKIFMETQTFDFDKIKERMRTTAYLEKGLEIVLKDEREGYTNETVTFKQDGGLKDFVGYLNKGKTPISQTIKKDFVECPIFVCESAEETTLPNDKKVTIMIDVALQYTNDFNNRIYSFCNNISTAEGGTHEVGLKSAIHRAIVDYDKEFIKAKEREKDGAFIQDDVLEGLTAVIAVKHPDPQYEGQTKSKLGNSEIRSAVYQSVKKYFSKFLQENKKIAETIIAKVVQAQKIRIRQKNSLDNYRKEGKLSTLAGKLSNCSSRNPEECELFIVEGNSAGGSAKDGRDAKTQAILPLRGKILNTQKAGLDRLFKNAEIGNMIAAIGGGFAETFDIEKIKFHKVIIMTDADVDGSHIRILLLTFFYKFMKELIKNGNIYVAQPPLYCVNKKYYAYSDAELEDIKEHLGANARLSIQRYKGLGEMDASQLRETTMDKENRKLIRVTLQDAMEADKIFEDLMGDEVEPRREFIEKNAVFVKNLDV